MLYERKDYTADISYLTNVFIREYDISKANINILYSMHMIDDNTYNYLFNAERMIRQIYIGKLQKDRKINEALSTGIILAKKMLFEANNIQEYEVLSIKNDAVYIIGRELVNTTFDKIQFIPKNIYTSYYRIDRFLELYYYYNSIDKSEALDIKGISDSILYKHQSFIQILKDIFFTIQCNGVEQALLLLKDIYNRYVSLQFPLEVYKKFDSSAEYHFKYKSKFNTGYSIDNATDSMKPFIDISYNLHILLEIQKIIVNIYFNN